MKSDWDKLSKEDKKKIEKNMLSLWGMAVFETYGNKCEVCGAKASDPHHVFPRGSYPNLKYEIRNGVPLCRKCHGRLHWRQDPRIMKAIIEWRGDEWWDWLNARAKNTFEVTPEFLLKKKVELEKVIYKDNFF